MKRRLNQSESIFRIFLANATEEAWRFSPFLRRRSGVRVRCRKSTSTCTGLSFKRIFIRLGANSFDTHRLSGADLKPAKEFARCELGSAPASFDNFLSFIRRENLANLPIFIAIIAPVGTVHKYLDIERILTGRYKNLLFL